MISTLGDALGAIFYELQNDLIWLHVKWHQYRVLYGSTPERIDLLNDAAPLAFRVVEDALWDDHERLERISRGQMIFDCIEHQDTVFRNYADDHDHAH